MIDGDSSVDIGPPRQRALLAVLLIHVGRVAPLPTIINAIWGTDPPLHVMATLQAYVSRLRKLLRRHDRSLRLARRLNGYLLEADPELVDAVVFEARVRDCREALATGDPTAARSLAVSALELWKGRPMGELYEYEFAVMEADRLDQVRLQALDTWAEACLETGSYEEVAVVLCEELRLNPSLERLGGHLMRAHYHLGQPVRALQTYERMRKAVAEELGVDLSRELRILHGEILRQELTAAPSGRVEAPPATPPESCDPPRPDRPDFRVVVREQETERLAGLVEDVRRGRGHVVLVLGEQGIGKSHLVNEAMRVLVPAGARTVHGHSAYVPSALPYWAWEQVRRQLDSGDGPWEPLAEDATIGAEWTASRHFAHRVRICQAVLSAAKRSPLVLIMEDLHAADVSTLEVLHMLAKQVSGAPVLVLATLRDHELAKDPAMRRMVGRILQEGTALTLRLKGLTKEESGRLIAEVRGAEPSAAETSELWNASDGNPFILLSLLSARAAGATGDQQAIPFEVREVLHDRLSSCTPGTLDVLTLSAVIGTQVPRSLLDEVLSARGLPRSLVDDALLTGLLHTDAATEGRLVFTHGLVRELLVGEAQPLARAHWNREVAEALAARFRPESDTVRIRHHCLESARVLGAPMGIRPLVGLADQAEERFQHGRALRCLEEALSIVAELSDEATPAVELHLCKRVLRLRARLEGYACPRVVESFGQAQRLERVVDTTQPTALLHTRAAMALVAGEYGLAAETGEMLHELAAHGGGPEAEAAACYAEGVSLHVAGRTEEALATLTRGVRLTDDLLGTQEEGLSSTASLLYDQRVDCRAYLALTHWINDDRDQAQHYRAEILRLTQSDRYDRPWDRAFARYVDAMMAVCEGDVEGAWRAGLAGVDLATRCQLRYWQRMLAVPLGWAEVRQGMAGAGLARIRRALREAAQHRTLLRRGLHLGLLGDALLYSGRAEESRLAMRCAAEEIERGGEYAYARPQWPYAALLGEGGCGSSVGSAPRVARR
ncbi:BTAD domain-containing putative transcriptional regulator [Streptomyces sp. HSG2]|uniref:BTAD domain-containing putative transcriptional regulator n=1 Tax=Streptomyces sp. HSG2 TaxID=2797167 RepID=UPI001F5B1E25|nr:BTAD domain-containing putative transcriptional regulator [Streptomyces sp. HSG2]